MRKHTVCDRRYEGGRGKPSDDCPECSAQISAGVIHSVECRMVFGRKDTERCARCRALASGVKPATTYRHLGRYAS